MLEGSTVHRGGDQREKRWKRQVECRYYVELEGAEPERGMKLLPRETADHLSLPLIPRHRVSPLPRDGERESGWGWCAVSSHEDVHRERRMMIPEEYPLSNERSKQMEGCKGLLPSSVSWLNGGKSESQREI